MKISSEIASAAKIIGEEKTVEYMGKAGFDAWDFSMFRMCKYDKTNQRLYENDHPLAGKDYLAFARKLRRIGEEYGMVCNQSHAPFPSRYQEIRAYFERALECTAEAGGKICVIHPNNDHSPEENAEMFLEILPVARAYKVKIATENMWNWDKEKDLSSFAACSTSESFVAHLAAVNDPFLVACLDIGHAEMRGSGSGAVDMILSLGEKLQALHVHDNDLWHDSHQLPGTMKIDFSKVLAALKQINYRGDFTLEADRYLSDRNEETVFDGICQMAKVAREMANQLQEK